MTFVKKATNNLKLLLVSWFALVLIVAGILTPIEHFDYPKSVWCTFITGLTVGYGDVYPTTLLGRTIMILFGLVTTFFFLSLIIGHIVVKLMNDPDAFTNAEQEDMKVGIKENNILLRHLVTARGEDPDEIIKQHKQLEVA